MLQSYTLQFTIWQSPLKYCYASLRSNDSCSATRRRGRGKFSRARDRPPSFTSALELRRHFQRPHGTTITLRITFIGSCFVTACVFMYRLVFCSFDQTHYSTLLHVCYLALYIIDTQRRQTHVVWLFIIF